jgi:hypothetical protein
MASFLYVKKLYEIGEKKLAYKNLIESIDEIDNDEALIALAMTYFNEIKNDPNMREIYTELCDALLKSKGLTLTQYLACLVDTDTNQRNMELSQVFSVKSGTSNQYIVRNNFESKGAFISDSIGVFYEKVKGNTIDIYECNIEENTITEFVESLDLNQEEYKFFFIGSDGMGGYYAIRTDKEDEKIYWLDHEFPDKFKEVLNQDTFDNELIFENFNVFLDRMIDDTIVIEREDEQDF